MAGYHGGTESTASATNGELNVQNSQIARTSPSDFERRKGRIEGSGDPRRLLLQHFEFAVITAVSQLGSNAYPAELARQLSKSLNRHVSLAQVFVALERMEDKGFVSSRDSEPDPVRGGRRRRIFQLEASGARAISNTAAIYRASSTNVEMTNGAGEFA